MIYLLSKPIEDVIEVIDLLEYTCHFLVILIYLFDFFLKFGLTGFNPIKERHLHIIHSLVEFGKVLNTKGILFICFVNFCQSLLSKDYIFLIFHDYLVVLLFLLLNLQPHIKVVDLDLFCKHLHLSMALCSLFQIFCYLPGNFFFQSSNCVRVLQKLSLGLTQLGVYVLVLPEQTLHRFLNFCELVSILLTLYPPAFLLFVKFYFLFKPTQTWKFMSLRMLVCISEVLAISAWRCVLSRSPVSNRSRNVMKYSSNFSIFQPKRESLYVVGFYLRTVAASTYCMMTLILVSSSKLPMSDFLSLGRTVELLLISLLQSFATAYKRSASALICSKKQARTRRQYIDIQIATRRNNLENECIQFKQISMIGIPHNKCFKSIREFQFIRERTLGSGSFGVVQLARHRSTCRMYAIKVVNPLPSPSQAKLIQRQIQLHSQADHPHLIKLWDTLLEDGNIYMVMEYAEGGNLFYHQNTKTIFTEPEAFRYFSQTLEGLSYLHRNDIIHRDLKPQNLLLDSELNIKICDFGWAAREIGTMRNTFCGTYEYMAPQMLFRQDYDYRVDIWALGVLLYELLHGYAPFKGKTATEVQQSMINGRYTISSGLSQSVQELISSILQTDADKRLSLQQINNHPWMIQMGGLIEGYLSTENSFSPKQIHQKISRIPFLPAKPKGQEHKKNGSLNIDLSDNKLPTEIDYLISKHINKFYSQEKEHQKDRKTPKENTKPGQPLILRKETVAAVKNHKNQVDLQRMLDRLRDKKSIKGSKELPSFDKQPIENTFVDVTNKKKSKNNKSDVDVLAQKYPVRFQTEACEQEWDHNKLKKSHLNAKLLGLSRSALRLQRGKMQLKF